MKTLSKLAPLFALLALAALAPRALPIAPAAAHRASFGAAPRQDGERLSQAELEASARACMRDIEELRGQTFASPVPVAMASQADFEAYVERMERELVPPDYAEANEVMLKMLGLLPADFDLEAATERMLADAVAGFYDPFSKSFYLCDLVPAGAELPFLVHELTHALDDQLFDLAGGLRAQVTAGDGLLAYRAVAEGSAQNLTTHWTMKHMGDFDMAAIAELEAKSLAGMAEMPKALWGPLVWCYLGGATFMTRGQSSLMGGRLASAEDVRAAFASPPLSTEQVLHPEKYWDPELRDDPTAVSFALGELPEGWRVRLEDTWGELGLAFATAPSAERDEPLTSPMQMFDVGTNAFASGWDGDRAILCESEAGARYLVLATVWDSERDAGEFFAGLAQLEAPIRANLAAMLDPEDQGRASLVGFDLEYGERPEQVRLALSAGVGGSERRKLASAVRATFE